MACLAMRAVYVSTYLLVGVLFTWVGLTTAGITMEDVLAWTSLELVLLASVAGWFCVQSLSLGLTLFSLALTSLWTALKVSSQSKTPVIGIWLKTLEQALAERSRDTAP